MSWLSKVFCSCGRQISVSQSLSQGLIAFRALPHVRQIHGLGFRQQNVLLHPYSRGTNIFIRHFKQKLKVEGRRLGRQRDDGAVKEAADKGKAALLFKPALFTGVVFVSSFSGAMIWQYETMRRFAKRFINDAKDTLHPPKKKFGFRQYLLHVATSLRSVLVESVTALIGRPSVSAEEVTETVTKATLKQFIHPGAFHNWWHNSSPGMKMVLGCISINCAVFVLWRIPALQPMLMKFFYSTPTSAAPSLSMFFSMFSHYNAWHLCANMYVLWSFSSIALSLLGKEQLAAVYISAGVFSGLTSYAGKVLRSSFLPSLGASGAIMAILGAVCVSFPEARLSIAFIGDIIPHSFTADTALKALIGLDAIGVLLGWKMFDHAAHLGGVLFGIWYVKYGRDMIWTRREFLMRWWHEFRGKP